MHRFFFNFTFKHILDILYVHPLRLLNGLISQKPLNRIYMSSSYAPAIFNRGEHIVPPLSLCTNVPYDGLRVISFEYIGILDLFSYTDL